VKALQRLLTTQAVLGDFPLILVENSVDYFRESREKI